MTLSPSQEDRAKLLATLTAYRQALLLLDQTRGANLVSLHEAAYETSRAGSPVLSRMVS